jgi:hypothetical protein
MQRMLKKALQITILCNAALLAIIVGVEPGLVGAIEDQFIVTQLVSSEISFLTSAGDVTMAGTLAGLTGGTSTGSTMVRVLTNESAGYTMTIKASSSPAMLGQTQGGDIDDYTNATAGVPDFTYAVPTGEEFAYTISASTTSDLAQKFLDNGSNTCNTGSSDSANGGNLSCWYPLSTTATSTVVRSTATPVSGATSTIFFRLTINSGSSVPEDTYVATTTLTVTTN